jgi:hypothetical protein
MPRHDVMLGITLAFAGSSRTFSSTRLCGQCQKALCFLGEFVLGREATGYLM